MTINRFNNNAFAQIFFAILLCISELTLAVQHPKQPDGFFINPDLKDVFISQKAKSTLRDIPNISHTLPIPSNSKEQWNSLVISKYKYHDKLRFQSAYFKAKKNLKVGSIIGHLPGYILATRFLGESSRDTDDDILAIFRKQQFENGFLLDYSAPTIYIKSVDYAIQLFPLESGLHPLNLLKSSAHYSNLSYLLMKSDETAPPIIAVITTKEISAGENLFIERVSASHDYRIKNTTDNESEPLSEESIKNIGERLPKNLEKYKRDNTDERIKMIEKITI